jgi:1,4-dihydroxy-2-naphthoate octaprenyltransferase
VSIADMTTRVVAVLVGVAFAVLVMGALVDLARRSLTFLLVGAVAFAAGWLVGVTRRREAEGRESERP